MIKGRTLLCPNQDRLVLSWWDALRYHLWLVSLDELYAKYRSTTPCGGRCQYAVDVGMTEYRCAGHCIEQEAMYEVIQDELV